VLELLGAWSLTKGWILVVPAATGITAKVPLLSENSAWLAKLAGPKVPSIGLPPLTDQPSRTSAPDTTPTSATTSAVARPPLGVVTDAAEVSGNQPLADVMAKLPLLQGACTAGIASAGAVNIDVVTAAAAVKDAVSRAPRRKAVQRLRDG
jgi:hypothetical protein